MSSASDDAHDSDRKPQFSSIGAAVHRAFDSNSHVVNFDDPALAAGSRSQLQDGEGSKNTPNATHSADVKALLRDGFVILTGVLSPAEVQEIRAATDPLLDNLGRNDFEGKRTKRVYGLLGQRRRSEPLEYAEGAHPFEKLAMHPRIMDIVDSVLLPNALLSAFQAIEILPGETRQPLHFDDQFCQTLPRPRAPVGLATIWAIDEFTADNGATVVFPGSHTWPQGQFPPPSMEGALPVVMPSGSVVVFLSTLWHGGGANTTKDTKRLCLTSQYCQPFMRPQENMTLVVPPEDVLRLPKRLQSLLGYAVHPPFIGHVNGRHPIKRISDDPTLSSRL